MKFSPHSFLMGADFVLGVVNEWKESTLLCENDLLCIVPLGWLSDFSFKNHFVDSVAVATGAKTPTPRALHPPSAKSFNILLRSSPLFLSCSCVFPSPYRVLHSKAGHSVCVPQQAGRWCVKSFCPVSLSALAAKQGFYYGTHDILYRFSGSINTQN